jgi:ribosomal protein S18 acetylase RimI-like enzyme
LKHQKFSQYWSGGLPALVGVMTHFQLDNIPPNPAQPCSQPIIRRARQDDLPELTDLLTSSFYRRTGWLGWAYPVVKLGIQEDLKQRINTKKPHYLCLTAVDVVSHGPTPNPGPHDSADSKVSGPVAGTLELSERQSWPWQPLSPKYIYLSNLAVRADLRRRGIALSLLVYAEQMALSWQFKDVYLHVMEDNVQARQLYQKAGFSLFQAEESPSSWLGLQSRRLLLHKSLAHHPTQATETPPPLR